MPFNFFSTLRSLSITFFLWAIYYTFELVLGCGAWCFFLWGRAFMVALLRAFAFFTPMASLSRSLHLPRSPLLPLPPRLLHTHLPPPPLLLTPSCSSPLPSPPAPPPPGPSASSLLEKLRSRQLRDRRSNPNGRKAQPSKPRRDAEDLSASHPAAASSFGELGLSDELMAAVQDLSLSKPTEVQCLGIPAVLGGEDVAIASHTGSGKTLAYMLPLVQCLRRDEMELEKSTRPRRPRAVVLCPTRELAEQVFRVSKSICHHARFRTAMIGGGCRMRPQEDSLNTALDMVVGTPGRLLMHIAEGNMAYGDIKYVVLDEADTMFDRGFGPEVRKFLGPLRNRSSKPGDEGFQVVLVTATITKAVQRLLDEEFPGIRHIRTSTLHKKIPTARHDFIKLSGVENKLEALLQVLEPSLAKRERVMVFCNTVSSCRAVDHFLKENTIRTVNYHGEVPAEERMEGLDTFRNVDGNCPALVCTDLAARGLDLVVDHVIMFDFPLNPIDYLHRTGRTARMGAKGKVTSLVTKRNLTLAGQIEDAIQKGETLEALTSSREKLEAIRKQAVKLNHREKMKTVKLNPREKMKTGNLATRQANRPVKGFKVGKPSPKKTPVFRLSKGATNVKAVSKSMGKGKSRKFAKSPVRV